MQNRIDHELAHRYIITELMIRTLERDKQHVEVFKSNVVMEKFFDQAIKKAKAELLAIKNEMGEIGLRLQEEKRDDELVIVYSFVQRGIAEQLRYTKYALRNHTMTELERLLEIK